MLKNLGEYTIQEKLYESEQTLVYRCSKTEEITKETVIIKLLNGSYPTIKQLVQFRNQYALTKNLDLPGVVKSFSLKNYHNSLMLIMEDFGGISLDKYAFEKKGLTIREFLPIAIGIVEALEGIHHQRIIHKDIKPANIVINPETKQVKLIDFSISSLLPKETQEIINPNILEGTLGYISPEQTGRMNRGIDYRSDFYSLGVTFYELLTGVLPFPSNEAMELVHCHIARMPKSPREIKQAIFPVLNDIVMKLMAKTAELRYQTAFGLKADLEKCLEQLTDTDNITPFKLATKDIQDRFVIPEKLYGREKEVSLLLETFKRVAEGSGEIEMMLVAGFSGIGKTAVVNEVHKPIVYSKGYFIKGKFDQFQRDIPLNAWVQAFKDLMRQLLTESASQIEQWKAKLLKALGENGQVIIDVIPELEILIGEQPPAAELEGSATQNRFNLLFEKFIRVFTTKEHPLVIFLDDLQWVDAASLKLIQLLASENANGHLLLIGAYRDNEVKSGHPLMLTLDEIRKSNTRINQITLAPLDESSLNCLIAQTLNCRSEIAVPLTEFVATKTKGNPFFATQLLKSLYEEGLITFNFQERYWQFDINRVKATNTTDDVVAFMCQQLRKLPKNTQSVLKLAACIGNSFDLDTLAIVYEKSQTETAAHLWKALQFGLVIPQREDYKFFQDSGEVADAHDMDSGREAEDIFELLVTYKFLHDRVQQAAYYLIPDETKQSTHLKLGQLLLKSTSIEQREEKIFEIVNQLNLAVELLTDETEREELAELNLVAGRKAIASCAYGVAMKYLNVGIELLGVSCWQTQYELTLGLYESAAKAASLNGDFEQTHRLTDLVLQNTKSVLDKVKVSEIKIYTYTAQKKVSEAINSGLIALALLGVDIPQKPSLSDIQLGTQETASLLTGVSIKQLSDLPPMADPKKLAIMRILDILTVSAYVYDSRISTLITLKQVNLSVAYGNATESTVAYVKYGMILSSFSEDINSGYQFGQLALSLVERLKARSTKASVVFYVNVWLNHWQEHINTILKKFLNNYYLAMENGDLTVAAMSVFLYCSTAYFTSKELGELLRDFANYTNAITASHEQYTLEAQLMYYQVVINLQDRNKKTDLISGEVYDETKMLDGYINTNHITLLCHLYSQKLILSYLFNNYSQALKNSEQTEKYLDGLQSTMTGPIFYFYNSLTLLAVYPEMNLNKQQALLEKVAANQEKMKKWGNYAPMNYLHKYYLVEAERYKVLGDVLPAMEYYDLAITKAKENEYLQEEALANELAAKFYLALGREKIASVYLSNAYYGYFRWGALAKVDDLEKSYPQLLPAINPSQTSMVNSNEKVKTKTTEPITSSSTVSSVLDLATVIKASVAISKEVNLQQLLTTLMRIALENAGGSFGALILQEDQQQNAFCQDDFYLTIEATAVLEDLDIVVNLLPSLPIEEGEIPVSGINYVARTKEILLLDDATKETILSNDPYIMRQQPKSVLCMPILNQNKLIGILYLENNLAVKAFTPDRLEVLKIISYQAAISIENARIYNNLEQKVRERTQTLSQTLEELKATQDTLIKSEKMAALGQLIAGIAHEINTPLGAIRASNSNIVSALNSSLEQMPQLWEQLPTHQQANFLLLLERLKNHNQSLSSREERQLRRSLKQELDTYGLGDTHNLADVLVQMGLTENITTFLPLLQDIQRDLIIEVANNVSRLHQDSNNITLAVERVSKIVFALKSYIHQDSSGSLIPTNITSEIDIVLTIYQNQLRQGIEVIKEYFEVPEILGHPEQLNQVWTNLIHNALQAMKNVGKLKIKVFEQGGEIVVQITDSGSGIPPEIKSRIFEPFFTTKPAGEGTGLGLDIAQKVVKLHQGRIEVESEPGLTTFSVFLPITGNRV